MAETTGNHGCPNCARLSKRLEAQEKRIQELEGKLAKALKNSANSSKPPSSDVTHPPPKRRKRGRPPKRKQGGQEGHPRHERALLSEDEVDGFCE